VKKDRFGKAKGPLSKVEIEREAQRELERLSRGAGARPAFTPPGGPPTALDDVADSVRGRSAPPPRPMGSPVPDLSAGPSSAATPFGGIPGGRGAPPPSLGPNQPFYDDDEEAADESANVTEIALRDHAARFGSDPEDLVIRQDPFAAEMMRDQAMRQFLDQQQSKDERPRRGPVGDPVTSVLNRLAARKKAEEEALARGDDGSGETVLDRIRARREAFEAEVNPPPPRQLHDEPGHRGRGRGRPPMTMVDDDDGEESALAIMRARAEARRPRPPTPSRVFAVPAADDPDDLESDQYDEQLEGDDDFADEDEALEPADDLDDDEVGAEADLDGDEDDYLDGSNADGPPTPDFAAEVARLSGGRTMGSVPARNRPKPAASSKRDAARRTSPAAPKRQAKAPVSKASVAKAPVAKAPRRSAAASKARPTKAPAAKAAAPRGRSTRPPATESRPTSPSAPRPTTTKGAAKTTTTGRAKATSGAGKASTARTRTPKAPTKAPPAPKARAKGVPAKAKGVPAKATAAPKGNGAASAAAAKKAAARARIADAAKRSRSSR